MTDISSGAKAPDPSDPPVSLDITPAESTSEKTREKPTKKPAKTNKESPEDTSAPIKVGRQQTESIRKTVRKLMLG